MDSEIMRREIESAKTRANSVRHRLDQLRKDFALLITTDEEGIFEVASETLHSFALRMQAREGE